MIDIASAFVDAAERQAAAGASLEQVLPQLRALDTDSFGELLLGMPNPHWPALSALLPAAPTETMNRHLTGDHGVTLLQKSVRFIRSLEHNTLVHTGRTLSTARILDYGFGFGRLTRLLLRHADPAAIYGCDVAARSLDWAKEYRLPGQYALVDEQPTVLPFADIKFDVIYAFSVFTHLSERVARAALAVLTGALSANSLLAITIRHGGFWNVGAGTLSPEDIARKIADHSEKGFAFAPLSEDFGMTSMSLGWLRQAFPELDMVGYDWASNDAQQVVVYLRPNWRRGFAAPT
jgi:SAM-dependent methyltransferase